MRVPSPAASTMTAAGRLRLTRLLDDSGGDCGAGTRSLAADRTLRGYRAGRGLRRLDSIQDRKPSKGCRLPITPRRIGPEPAATSVWHGRSWMMAA